MCLVKRVSAYVSRFVNLNLSGVCRKEPILAIIYDGGGCMLLSV